MQEETGMIELKVFNVADYELNETATLILRNARDDDDLRGTDGLPVTITLYGAGSEQHARASYKVGNRATARAQAMLRGKQTGNQSEEAEEDQIVFLTAITHSISSNFPVAPRDLYANRKLTYIRSQIERFIADNANFSKPSAPN